MRTAGPSRAHFLFWLIFVSFASAAGALLFFSEPLFLGGGGAKASLVAEARKWRGMPPGVVTARVGAALKGYLDASRHASRAAVRVSEARPDRLSLDVRLPWAEVSAKKRRQRAEVICRLGGAMLEGAGAVRATLLVNLRRMRRDSAADAPAGRMTYSPGERRCAWEE